MSTSSRLASAGLPGCGSRRSWIDAGSGNVKGRSRDRPFCVLVSGACSLTPTLSQRAREDWSFGSNSVRRLSVVVTGNIGCECWLPSEPLALWERGRGGWQCAEAASMLREQLSPHLTLGLVRHRNTLWESLFCLLPPRRKLFGSLNSRLSLPFLYCVKKQMINTLTPRGSFVINTIR